VRDSRALGISRAADPATPEVSLAANAALALMLLPLPAFMSDEVGRPFWLTAAGPRA
jgi:hypothetical protein